MMCLAGHERNDKMKQKMIQTHFDTDVYSLSYGHKTQYDADNIT